METTDGPTAISINPSAIKAAQEEMGRLDVLVCGQCHSVFHLIEDFQEHRSKEGVCSKKSHFRESSNNEQKAQVWAFLLWKDTQTQQESPDKDTASSWNLYKKWCNMENNIRECWITAGKTIQTFTKISNTKMTDVPKQRGTITTDGGRTLFVHKVIRNGQPDSPGKKEIKPDFKLKTEPMDRNKVKLRPSIKPKTKNEFGENNVEDSNEEFVVEKILAKRFNPKKKVYEYLLKWEGYAHEHNTWEEVENVSVTCKQLMDEFEKNLAKQKELKALHVQKSMEKSNQMSVGHKIIKKESVKPGPSTSSPRRPMRTSKSKAMDNVKNWVDVMKGEEERTVLGKRKIPFSDSDSDDGDLAGLSSSKRSKADTSGDDDWTADSEEDKTGGGGGGRSDVIQKAFSRATNGSQSNSIFAKTVKTEGSAKPQSTMYFVHRKDGVIRLDHTPTDSIALKTSQVGGGSGVLMVQNREGNLIRKQVASLPVTSAANAITCEKVISKPDGTQVVTQMKVVPKSSPAGKTFVAAKSEPVKIKPKPDPNQAQQIQLITAGLGLPNTTQKVVTTARTSVGANNTPRATADAGGRPLLPRPPGMRGTSTPTTTTGSVSVAQSKTPARAPPQRQGTPAGVQQRQLLQQQQQQKKTIVQVASPNALPSVRPKITVMNAQGPLMHKIVSPAGKPTPKSVASSPVASRPLPSLTTTQKLQAAKKKAEQEAGVVSKTGARGNNAASRAGARGKPKVTVAAAGNKPKESKLAVTGGLHMEFHQVESEESSDGESEFPPLPADQAQGAPEPESPPRLTLCPLTGRIIGPDGEPVDTPETNEQPAVTTSAEQVIPVAIVPASTTATISADGTITTVSAGESSAELVLPTMEGLTDSTGAVVRVEMSPGGTTGMIVQSNESAPVTLSNVVVPGPDLPCLDDPNIEVQTTSTGGVVVNVSTTEAATSAPSNTAVETTTTTTIATDTVSAQPMEVDATTSETVLATSSASDVKLEEAAVAGHQMVTLTGDDGVVYHVAGQSEDGQTLLVAQGADGEQQCVYVTADVGQTGDGQSLTIDQTVADAVAQLMPDQMALGQQYYVKDGTAEGAEATTSAEGQVVMSVMENAAAGSGTEDADGQAQVVAQVIQADPPTEDGRRRVVLLLPDGNLMMTEVDEEQYAALELDK